jgi:DNA-directed RNA polymerase specialized sigma24 family protein
MKPSPHEVTRLLQAWSEGNQGALEELMSVVYDELHRLARHYMADERPGHTLQTTALVNEAYLRLADSAQPSWAEPRSILRCVRAGDAAHPGGLGPFSPSHEARR